MARLLNFFKGNLLKILVSALIIFIPLYPKLPSVHVAHTWVYIRLEDFLILFTVVVWLLGLVLKKFKLPPKIWIPFAFYLGIGAISLVFSLIYIAPHLANFFPSVAVLYYIRHIEYLLLFFVAFSTIKSKNDVRDYLIVLSVAIIGFSIYAFGQRFYIDLWVRFPDFFEKFSYCFPSFQTGNEEFAKGIPLCLPKEARITSTFAGHYDLAAYLVLIIPILIGFLFSVKKWFYKIPLALLTLTSITVLIFTASRVSFIAYLLAITVTLILIKAKRFIIPFYILSIVLLLTFSGSTAKRFMETFRIANVVINNQGQVIGKASLPDSLKNKVADNILENIPTQNLPEGSGFLGLPQIRDLQKTDKAIIESALSLEEARRLKLENGGVEISTVSGSFLIKKVLVYDISFTTRFQAEWPNAWSAMLRNPLLGSGFATITLAADNNYLRILGETGLLGLISFLSIFFILALILKQSLPKINDKQTKYFLFGIIGGILGLFFNAVLIDVFEASKLAETMWILLGVGAGTIFLYKKDFSYKDSIVKNLTSSAFAKIYLLFLLLVFYLKSVTNFFVGDDFTWLKWSATTNLSDLPKFFIDSQGFFYRPLDKTVMYFLYTLFSFTPNGYHTVILIVHFAVALVLYSLINKLFNSKLLAFIGAFVFLFLPSQGEIVYWISTISISLSTLFIALLIKCWIDFRENGSKIKYVLGFIFALLALLSYEGAIVLLGFLILVDLFIAKRKITSGKTILGYIPFAIITAAYPFVRTLTNTVAMGGDYTYNLTHLIPNFFGNFTGYLGLMILGEPFLPLYIKVRELLKPQTVSVVLLILVVLFFVGYFAFKKRNSIKSLWDIRDAKIAVLAILFMILSLLPFLGLGNISERYSYLASFGFSILAVVVLKRISEVVKAKNLKVYLLIIITVVLGSWFYYQNRVQTAQWHEAGRITQRTLTFLRLYFDGEHPNTNFYFVNTPIRKKEAWVFPVGLSDGVWFIYRDNSINVRNISSLPEGKSLAKQPGNFVFAFDKNGNIYAVK